MAETDYWLYHSVQLYFRPLLYVVSFIYFLISQTDASTPFFRQTHKMNGSSTQTFAQSGALLRDRKQKTFKIIVIGDSSVGKTCLTFRWVFVICCVIYEMISTEICDTKGFIFIFIFFMCVMVYCFYIM